MGMGVAESLLRAGYKTYVRDIVAERMTEAEKLGAIACASPAVMARYVEVFIILVVDAMQVEDVLFGIGGAA